MCITLYYLYQIAFFISSCSLLSVLDETFLFSPFSQSGEILLKWSSPNLNNLVPSANMTTSLFTNSPASFMKELNRTGLNTEDWRVPLLTFLHHVNHNLLLISAFWLTNYCTFLWTGHCPLLINPALMENNIFTASNQQTKKGFLQIIVQTAQE